MEPTTGSTSVESSPSVSMEAKLLLSSSHADCQTLKELLSKESATSMVAVMAFISKGNEPSSSAAAGAKPPAVAMDAKIMVSRGHGECQEELKNLLNKKDATIKMVMTASCAKQQDSKAKPSLNSSELLLLAAASEADLDGLKVLLGSDGASRTSNGIAAANVNEGMINVAAPSVVSSPLKIVNSSEGGTKCNEIIIPVQQVAESSAASSLLKVVTMDGDSALHLLAANGANVDDEKVKSCAEFIHGQDNKLLYEKKNNRGDTPLHCAVRAGKSELVTCLISLAKKDGKVQDLLRTLNNNEETALHEAVRRGDKVVVKELMKEDPELASFPKNGVSPLYLAIQLLNDTTILGTLHDESEDGSLSYLGPNGQNALHAAVLRSPVLTRKLLRWNMDLTMQKDGNGSTPLHFAAGLLGDELRRGSVCSQLLKANKGALYQVDNDGLYPIHVAASVGAFSAIALFVKECPGSAGLRDAKGRTVLHVAVENKQVRTVYACMNPWLARILYRHVYMDRSQQASIVNMQDDDGNTALHLAVKSGSLLIFCALLANRKVDLNIPNAEGQTPLDIAKNNIAKNNVPPPGLLYNLNKDT